jgi:hypothetical protein
MNFMGESDMKHMNDLLKGWNILNNNMIGVINSLLSKEKWDRHDLKYINQMIKDGVKPALDYIFLIKNKHYDTNCNFIRRS